MFEMEDYWNAGDIIENNTLCVLQYIDNRVVKVTQEYLENIEPLLSVIIDKGKSCVCEIIMQAKQKCNDANYELEQCEEGCKIHISGCQTTKAVINFARSILGKIINIVNCIFIKQNVAFAMIGVVKPYEDVVYYFNNLKNDIKNIVDKNTKELYELQNILKKIDHIEVLYYEYISNNMFSMRIRRIMKNTIENTIQQYRILITNMIKKLKI